MARSNVKLNIVQSGEKHTQIEWLIDEKVNLWIFRTTDERKVSTNCLSEWNNQNEQLG